MCSTNIFFVDPLLLHFAFQFCRICFEGFVSMVFIVALGWLMTDGPMSLSLLVAHLLWPYRGGCWSSQLIVERILKGVFYGLTLYLMIECCLLLCGQLWWFVGSWVSLSAFVGNSMGNWCLFLRLFLHVSLVHEILFLFLSFKWCW